jgi:CIC family chloride channel protein
MSDDHLQPDNRDRLIRGTGHWFSTQSDRFVEARQKLNAVLLWAVLVGILIGLAGSLFRIGVQHLIQQRTYLAQLLSNIPLINWLIPSLVAGLMVYVSFGLMRRFAPETGGSGIPQIEGVLDNLLPLDWWRVLPVKFFGGTLSLGASMVAGYEGPTIQMGGSIGRMIASWVSASQEQTRILIAAGAGAGLAAAFNAPLAGILFVTEEVRPKFESSILSYRAITVAVLSATIVVRGIFGQGAFLKMTRFERVPLESLWMFVILGIGLGVVGYFFNFFLFRTSNWFGHLQGIPYQLLGLWVGAVIGLLAWFNPTLVGSGDDAVLWALNSNISGRLLLLFCLARFALTMFCYGSGAIGGIFAPMLAIATTFSLGVARELYDWFPAQLPEPTVFGVVGMGALVAATVRAPLTAILLTLELTDNYLVILPLLMTCIVASMTAHLLGGEPIYSVLLKRTLEKRQHLASTDSV